MVDRETVGGYLADNLDREEGVRRRRPFQMMLAMPVRFKRRGRAGSGERNMAKRGDEGLVGWWEW